MKERYGLHEKRERERKVIGAGEKEIESGREMNEGEEVGNNVQACVCMCVCISH